MKLLSKVLIVLFLVTVLSTSCTSSTLTPETNPTNVMETAISIAKTAMPTSTFTATPIPSLVPATETSIPSSNGVIYYYFVPSTETNPPSGSILMAPDTYILGPTTLDIEKSADIVTDLTVALEAVLKDERNGWINKTVEIVSITFNEGHADVVLQGEYFGVAHITLAAARMQILMTIFANTSLQTATVIINGDTIANISISNSQDAKPIDYAYTRAEIETFIAEHAYVKP